MNLKSKKARVPITGVTLAALASGGLMATSASAVGETLSVGSTSATIINTNPIFSNANAATTFGVRVSGAPSGDTDALHLKVLSAPTGGSVYFQREAGLATPTGNSDTATAATAAVTVDGTAGTTTLNVTLNAGSIAGYAVNDYIWIRETGKPAQIAKITAVGGGTITLDRKLTTTYVTANITDLNAGDADVISTVPVDSPVPVANYSTAGNDTIYLGATVPGTYTYRLFKNRNISADYEGADDDSTPVLTLTVKDVTANTGDTSDDLDFALTVPSNVTAGDPVPASAAPTLTRADARGVAGSPAVGQLAIALASRMNFAFSGAGAAGSGAPTATATAFTRTSTATNAAGTTTTTPSLGYTSTAVGGTATFTGTAKTTTVSTNEVTTLAVAPKAGQSDDVALIAGDYVVRAGYDQVAFEATATVATGSKAGKLVTFTVDADPNGGGDAGTLAGLKVNGVAPTPVGGSTTVGTVTATTNANGVATFLVDSSRTSAGNEYAFSATSGLATDGGTDVVYAAPAVDSLETSGNLAATIGGSVNLTGRVLDQWGSGYVPAGSPQATLTIDKSNATFATADESHSVDIAADGKFSYAYSDAGNSTARTDAYRWTVGATSSVSSQIRWVASNVPAKASITGLGSNGAFPVPDAFDVAVSSEDTANTQLFTGVVREADDDPLPFGEFSLSGSEGVYFINSAGKAVTTLAGRANESGQVSVDGNANGVQVLFTKSGEETEISLKVGTAAAVSTGTFTVDQPLNTDDWKVVVNELTVAPGENGTISGRVEDPFGNAVPGVSVDLSLEGADFGVITSNTSPVTNSQGRFSALFASGSTDSGIVKVVAEINGGSPVTVPAGTLTDGPLETGIAYQAGVNRAEQNITVKAIKPVTIVAPASRVGPGSVEISGVANPGSPVDIYVKRTGTTDDFRLLQTVTVDTEGEWGAEFDIVRSATIYAKQGTAQSDSKTITVFSSVTLNATALGGGKVELRGDGNPNQATKMSFYTFDGGKLRKIETVPTNSKGFASHVATLSKGAHSIRAYYVATGTRSAFAQKTITVK